MKKITLFLAVGLLGAATAFTSCNKKKDYVCVCEIPITGGDPVVQSHTYNNVTKKEAQDACNTVSAALLGNGSCKLQ